MRPRDVIGHTPGEPLDLPSQLHTSSGGAATTTDQAAAGTPANPPPRETVRQPANITVTPPVAT